MSRWVNLRNPDTSRLVVDKDWTTDGQRSQHRHQGGPRSAVPSPGPTLRAFPLTFKTRRPIRGLSPSHSVSVRVMSVSRLSDRSRYCSFFRRWDVKQGITKTCLEETNLHVQAAADANLLASARPTLALMMDTFLGYCRRKPNSMSETNL